MGETRENQTPISKSLGRVGENATDTFPGTYVGSCPRLIWERFERCDYLGDLSETESCAYALGTSTIYGLVARGNRRGWGRRYVRSFVRRYVT